MNYINLIIISFISFSSCFNMDDNLLSKYDFSKSVKYQLESELNEVSGLATAVDDNIFCINDEKGTIFKVNVNSGKINKKFHLKSFFTVEEDFEGLAATKENIFAITSSGELFEFSEGKNNEEVEYTRKQLPFNSKFNIEGLYYDKEKNGLLILPKEYSGKKYSKFRAIYLYSLKTQKVDKEPYVLVSLKELKKKYGIKGFYPSGITKDPTTGNYLIISSKGEKCIVEISNTGKIVNALKLKKKDHRQPEGITLLSDLTLVISDEAAGKKPTLTLYKYKN